MVRCDKARVFATISHDSAYHDGVGCNHSKVSTDFAFLAERIGPVKKKISQFSKNSFSQKTI